MLSEQVIIFFQIVFIDLVLAGDNAIIIGMVASQFPADQRKKIIFWGIGAAILLRIIFTLLTAYLLQINGLRLIGGILLLYICYIHKVRMVHIYHFHLWACCEYLHRLQRLRQK